jgi:adenylate cyclase class 2
MKPEIEAKFLDIDHDAVRERLTALGAVCRQPMRLMKRRTYDFPDGRLRIERNGWARVRDEGDKITMSYKQLNDRGLDGTHEVSVVVNDFAAADDFLQQLGLEGRAYQETKRESWELPGFEIELDIWPWAKPYVEIEGPDEASLQDLAAKLGLDWEAVCHGSVEIVYQGEYDVTDEDFNTIQVVTFEEPIPDLLEKNRRS